MNPSGATFFVLNVINNKNAKVADAVSSQESEQVLALKGTAMLKECDNVTADDLKIGLERGEHRKCQQKRAEIPEQIKAVANQRKNGAEPRMGQ